MSTQTSTQTKGNSNKIQDSKGSISETQTSELPDVPAPDRLMSSVMSMAQEAVSRVEMYRAGVEQMLAHEQSGVDGWWKGWEMLKAAYQEEVDART